MDTEAPSLQQLLPGPIRLHSQNRVTGEMTWDFKTVTTEQSPASCLHVAPSQDDTQGQEDRGLY